MFDSGVGGISVLHSACRMLDAPEYLYYADEAHAPYGKRDAKEVRAYATDITRFLIEQGADAIVIACNTATSAAVRQLREMFDLPIIGMEPAVKPALLLAHPKGRERVLVLATPLTIAEEKLERLLLRFDKDHRTDLLALPGLVDFAEKGIFEGDGVDAYLEEALSGIDRDCYAAVVPGCTHFLFFLPQLQRHFPEDCVFVDGNAGTVRHLAEVMHLRVREEKEARAAKPKITYYVSGREVTKEEERQRFDALHARLDTIAALRE